MQPGRSLQCSVSRSSSRGDLRDRQSTAIGEASVPLDNWLMRVMARSQVGPTDV